MAVALVLVIGVSSAIFVRRAARQQQLAQLLDMHVAALASANPVDVVSSDRHTVKPWFQGKLPFTFNLHDFPASLHSLWVVPQIFGADYRGLSGGPYYTALLHMVGLGLVALALLLVIRRFFSGASLVDQVLGVAIVLNLALFVLTSAGSVEVTARTPRRLPPVSRGTTINERDSMRTRSSSPGRAIRGSGRDKAGRWTACPVRKTSTAGMRRWRETS